MQITALSSKRTFKSQLAQKSSSSKAPPKFLPSTKSLRRGALGAGALVVFAQALSRNWLFGDPQAGQLAVLHPAQRTICHEDRGVKYIFPAPKVAERKDVIYFVTFGVNISAARASLGAKMLANTVNSPVLLIHNGSTNIFLDYLRAGLSRLHCWPLGRGNEVAIAKIKEALARELRSERSQEIKLVGHSAGASSLYGAINDFIREYPELMDAFRQRVSLHFMGSPEYLPDMQRLAEYCPVTITNRQGDYIADAFEGPLLWGLALPVALWRLISNLLRYGNQHRAILYLSDFAGLTYSNS